MNVIKWAADRYAKGGVRGITEPVRDFIHYNVTSSYHSWNKEDVSHFYGAQRTDDGYVKHQLPGYELLIDPSDPGIGRELLSQGIREAPSYWQYRQHVRELDSPNVFEAGSNIGYYAIAAAVDAPDGDVLCAELDADNVSLCQRNIDINKCDNISIEQAALGASDDTITAAFSEHSNRHSLKDQSQGVSETVNTIPTAEFLRNNEIDAANVDVLRMDVEGFELEILRGAPDLSPHTAHIEVHPNFLERDEWEQLICTFENWPCELTGVYKSWKKFPVRSVRDLPVNKSVQLVFA